MNQELCPALLRVPLLGLVAASLVLAPEASSQETGAPIPSVIVATVVSKDVTPSFRYVGRAEAVDKVDLRARVEGILEQRNFQEGRFVNKGDLLFVIEKAPYEIVVEEREADLAGAEANRKNARADLARKRELREQNVLSQADLDSAEAAATSSGASVLQAQASLKRAHLDLSYTEIYSPLDGQISRARYSVGNLVGPSSDPLATVSSVDPIYVNIAVSEKQLLEARRQGIDLDRPRVAPHLILADGSEYEHDGHFDYLDPEVSQSTDTILARAVFPNPDQVLVSGQFVSVIVKQKQAVSALVVPQASVQEDQQGFFVLVVNQSDKVEVRRVRVGDQVGTDWVISDGLATAERIIVQGIQKVRPDMVVEPISGEQ